jgi:sialate O-acetylesterase
MVLQRNSTVPISGTATPSQELTVTFNEQTQTVQADADGNWSIDLDVGKAGGPYQMEIVAASSEAKILINDVMVGDVWLCSGQSNMAWPVSNANDADLESLAANFPRLRLISVPKLASQEPQHDFDGQWEACKPETVKDFSAVGYFFGRQLHQTLDVPVGLIDNAWGGSAAEAWVRRDVLENAGSYDELLTQWDDLAKTYDHEKVLANWSAKMEQWNKEKKGPRPRKPQNKLTGQHRPANLYNGVLMPVLGYTSKGVIWYQGESNAGRAYQYRDLFPLMIQNWRDDWGQKELPFYWVQLADYLGEVTEPQDSAWAELREAQTMTMSKLPNTGEAVIVDLGEASDIHPKNKQVVGKRLARWALANDYGIQVPFRSPTYKSVAFDGAKAILKFDHVGNGLDTFDVREPIGFTIAGDDRKFVFADARIVGKDTVEVWSETVKEPVAVRYAWANNPVCNVQSKSGLQMTPFRTDQWPGVTQGIVK